MQSLAGFLCVFLVQEGFRCFEEGGREIFGAIHAVRLNLDEGHKRLLRRCGISSQHSSTIRSCFDGNFRGFTVNLCYLMATFVFCAVGVVTLSGS